MASTEYLYKATRDVIGGAMGGLMAAWVLTDRNKIAIIMIGVFIVFSAAIIYYTFEKMIDLEDERTHGS